MPHPAKWLHWGFIVILVVLGLIAFKLGESFFFHERQRDPASDQRGPDLSALEGPEFIISARLRIIEGLAVQQRDGRIFLTAGHFLGPRSPISVCATYNDVEYEFAAADQASHGDPITLTLSTACESTDRGGQLEELEVPVERILREKVRDLELQVYGKRNVNVKVENVADEWPRVWSLRAVRLYNSSSEIRVDGSEIYRLRGKPLEMKW